MFRPAILQDYIDPVDINTLGLIPAIEPAIPASSIGLCGLEYDLTPTVEYPHRKAGNPLRQELSWKK